MKRTTPYQKQMKELLTWLTSRIEYAETIVAEARKCHNYGKEIQYASMRDAYLKCIQQISQNTANSNS